MDYDLDFLTECRDEPLRKRLWDLFQKAEKEARAFCGPDNPWVPIVKVIMIAQGCPGWCPDGTDARIKIPVSCGNLGVIFHEVFHSAFDQSPLGQAKGNCNDKWGDAFCDAFRYFMDGLHLCDPPREDAEFLPDFEGKMTKPSKDILGDHYQGWASRIVLKAEKDYDEFKRLWRERNAKPNEPLATYFFGDV